MGILLAFMGTSMGAEVAVWGARKGRKGGKDRAAKGAAFFGGRRSARSEGQGAPMMGVVLAAGISWHAWAVVRITGDG